MRMIGPRTAAWVLLVCAQGAEAQEETGPVPATNPATWIQANDYPPAARRVRAEGRTVVKLGVDAGGRVTSCAVAESSGNAALDAATCAVLTGRARFKPALSGGEPVASTYSMPVRWQMPPDGPPPPVEVTAPDVQLDTELAVELNLDGEGMVLDCRVLANKAPASVDPCAMFQVGQRGGPPLRRNGQAVAYKVVQRLTRQVTVAP